MDELDRRAEPLGASLLVHQARHVGGGNIRRTVTLVISYAIEPHFYGHGFFRYAKRPSETATLIPPVELN